MHFNKGITQVLFLIIITLGVIFSIYLVQNRTNFFPGAQYTPPSGGLPAKSESFQAPLTSQEKSEVESKISSSSKNSKQAIIRSIPTTSAKDGKRAVEVMVFDYQEGKSKKYIYNLETNEIESQTDLNMRPQSSLEERETAIEIIKSDQDISTLISQGGKLNGGFIVNCPEGIPNTDRCIQYHISSPDNTLVQKVIFLNLTTRGIVKTLPN